LTTQDSLRIEEDGTYPARPGVLVEGAVYRVYRHLARAAEVFGESEEVDRLVTLLREVRDRDGLIILAQCVVFNHYHLAVRVGAGPLVRPMSFV
jgi:hypothetical protein